MVLLLWLWIKPLRTFRNWAAAVVQGKGVFHSGCLVGGNRCGHSAEIHVQYFPEDFGRMHADCKRSLHLGAALPHSPRVAAAGHAQVQQGESPLRSAAAGLMKSWNVKKVMYWAMASITLRWRIKTFLADFPLCPLLRLPSVPHVQSAIFGSFAT